VPNARQASGDSAMAKSGQTSRPVCIVGGGPVGLCLALLLDRMGVRSTVFNTETTKRWQPKGNGQNSRTMEHFRQLGGRKSQTEE